MENVHGVDVSWLHRPQRDATGRPRAPSSPAAPLKQPKETAPPASDASTTPRKSDENGAVAPLARVKTEPIVTPTPAPTSQPTTDPTVMAEDNTSKSAKRPPYLSRSGQDKGSNDGVTRTGRRASWISNISSRFSSATSPLPSPASPQLSKPVVNGSHVTSPPADFEKLSSPQLSPSLSRGGPDDMSPYVPQRPKESGSSFFSSITKRLAPMSQTGVGYKVEHGGVWPRKTLNVNPNRARCKVAELDHSRLRRVSFSVDIEIASGPKYKDDTPAVDKAKKTKDKKMKERAEGEALKHPQAASELKDKDDERGAVEETLAKPEADSAAQDPSPGDDKDPKAKTRKQEKKKRSEEERKERNEKKRRRAEENGTLPLELRSDDDSQGSSRSASLDAAAAVSPPPAPKTTHDRPTTDPVRIYRRCCQLRESPILKRITEQLMAPDCTDPADPGTVTCLNLTGSRLQLADFITLGDWLAIVPVRRLLLEDSEIVDEGLRVVLSGLLAAKKPEPTRAKHRNSQSSATPTPERAGVIERLTLKNNPRITRVGWKYLATFLNMCRSIKTVDLSMLAFPETLPMGFQTKNASQTAQSTNTDAAELFAKSIAERVGGDKLEEVIMSECGLDAIQIRRIVDAMITAGVKRIGFAGCHLNQDGFECVLDYVRSGVCEALDIGCNEFDKDQMAQLAEALTHKTDLPIWGLSLANCGLDPASLKALFPAFTKVPLLRFLDFSHNRHLFENGNPEALKLFRKYLSKLKNLKRIHLMDVGLSAKQTIGLAEVLPEGPSLAHVGLLENTELSKLVASTDESSQEEACALYASLMTAVRVSSTIICIDIDVPAPDNSEVVKALAKQIIAYCLRNMELMPLSSLVPGAPADAGKPDAKEGGFTVTYPEVLMHLVGNAESLDTDHQEPDVDYIVGSTGVVKALEYCLGEVNGQDSRRGSANPTSPPSRSGTSTPVPRDRDQQAVLDLERRGKAREMSKSLLGSARNIRNRLRPVLLKESREGDEVTYRRLNMVDTMLGDLIHRFEVEFPECRVQPPSASPETEEPSSPSKAVPNSIATLTSSFGALSTDLNGQPDSDDDSETRPSRRGSEVTLASRAQTQEEGRMHRFGHELRQEVMKAESLSSSPQPGPADEAAAASAAAKSPPPSAGTHKWDEARLAELQQRLEQLTGGEVKAIVDESGSLESVLGKFGATITELRTLQETDPLGWERFVQSQLAARKNIRVNEGQAA